jgi:hypothetical protein
LLDFLGIKTTPTPTLVVAHLLSNASAGKPVNLEVYRFLNNNAADPAVASLANTRCLLLKDNTTYIEPAQVFWGDHPFGRFRKRLSTDLRCYSDLFERLRVREAPDQTDALKVIAEISEAFGAGNTPLDEEADAVLLQCWRMLETALDCGNLPHTDLASLQSLKCIPNSKRVLNPPDWMFFEDRAGVAAKFHGFLKLNVIPRPLGAWKAMTAAGVRTLGTAVEIHLIECVNPVENQVVSERVRRRKTELARVFEAATPEIQVREKLRQLERVRFESVDALTIRYTLRAFNQVLESNPEPAPALFQRESELLLFVSHGGQAPWSPIARELALALFPNEEPGRIAPGLKEVLAAATDAEAKAVLDELGFATLEATEASPAAQGETVEALGGETSIPETPVTQEPASPPAAAAPTDLTAEEAVNAILGPNTPPPTPPPPGLDRPDMTATGGSTGSAGSAGATQSGSRTSSGTRQTGPQQRRKRGRLRTYVIKNDEPDDTPPDTGAAQRRSELDEAGIAKVVAFEQAASRQPDVKPPKHPGFDIESRDANGAVLRFIEVKSLSGDWGSDGVGLTKTQFEKAREVGDRYWLYVVERADKSDAQIHCIHDPARRVDQFLFDDGWRDAADGNDVE